MGHQVQALILGGNAFQWISVFVETITKRTEFRIFSYGSLNLMAFNAIGFSIRPHITQLHLPQESISWRMSYLEINLVPITLSQAY